MGEKDITQKILMDNADVFADIVNTLMFDGKLVIDEENVISIKEQSQYKADGKIHEQERDTSKLVSRDGKKTLIGIENQTVMDEYMPVRIMGYDGASYRKQLLGKEKNVYPVITLVLYFGEKNWNERTSLQNVIDAEEIWKPYINDYKINIYEIANLSPEQVKKFKSDFGIVADYFVQKRQKKEYEAPDKKIRHVDELLKLMSVLTEDDRFEEHINELQGRGEIRMCDVLDRIEERGIKIGESRGIKIGEMQGEIKGEIKALYFYMNKTPGEISRMIEKDETEVMEIIRVLEKDS